MKYLALLAIFFAVFFIIPGKIFADDNFDISAETTYTISDDSKAQVEQTINILNKKEFVFSPNYTISFGFEDIGNIQVYNSSGSIPFDYKNEDGVVTLTINFKNPPKGINTVNSFTVSFETDELVEKKGEVFEVDIPGISDPESFTKYDTKIVVSSNFPEISIIKPDIEGKKENLTFSKDEIKGAGIVLIFGENQYFNLNLVYNISNPNLFPIVTEIALPPDTNYQTVYIENISDKPNNVKTDSDGNWLAQYTLLPREKKSIKVNALVKVFSKPLSEEISEEQIKLYTMPNEYWEKNNPEIKKIASNLKTPQDVYDYTVKTLKYDYEKISQDNKRLGGASSIKTPENAVCLEFSDLFITLSRAAGIPARSVEGYAHTRNSKLRPLSFKDDILHAWVEYYDFEKKSWIMADPTWGNTTRGIDYFNNFDLDHIAFVIKGAESTYPIPAGGYKFDKSSKDIETSFISTSNFKLKDSIQIGETFPTFSFAGVPITGFVNITNNGNSTIKNKKIYIKNLNSNKELEFTIKNLAPLGQETFKVSFDTHFLTNDTHDIKIHADGIENIAKVKVSFIPDLGLILIGGGIFVSTGLVTFFAYKTWCVYIQRRKRSRNIRR